MSNPLNKLAQIQRELDEFMLNIPTPWNPTPEQYHQLDSLHADYRSHEKEALGVYELTDISDLQDPDIRANAARVGALIQKPNGPISFSTVGCSKGLCQGQPHHSEPYIQGFVGTGFMLDGNRIVTTKHISQVCKSLGTTACWENLAFIPNHENVTSGSSDHQQLALMESDRKGIPEGWDWAKIVDFRPTLFMIQIDPAPLKQNEEVYIIGHPLGMRKKFAKGIVVNQSVDKSEFTMIIPAMDGSSGSPIFRTSNHKLIGMMYKGKEQLNTIVGKPCENAAGETCHAFKKQIKTKTAHHISTLKIEQNGNN